MTWQRGTLADFMGDEVVYRNLEPMVPGRPGLSALWCEIGLDHYFVPRKTSPAYARALLRFLQDAQRARGVASSLTHLLFIGDTLLNDGTAARNCAAHLPLRGFIGADRLQEPRQVNVEGELMLANRWAALSDFLEWIERIGWPCDERTALLIDLDKTSLGARGRNDKVIDRARLAAVERTMRGALGPEVDFAAFRAFYDRLNQPAYHFFTADNQDYLAYICLMVTGGVFEAQELWDALDQGQLTDFTRFVAVCGRRTGRMSPPLYEAHREVVRGLAKEDPTPFKGFRRGEYLETLARMDMLEDGASPTAVLTSEIVITAEVANAAQHLREKGVLVFGLSDKPDEASVPTAEQAEAGYPPIHRALMKVYGQRVA